MLPVFCHEIKTRTLIKMLRHSSPEKNVRITHRESQFIIMYRYINRDIHDTKIKVKISPLYSHFL